MTNSNAYQHLERRPCSNYRQLFVKGRKIRAEILYWQTVGEEPQTPEEVAFDYDLPLEAVLEAIDYCHTHPDVIQADHDSELAGIREDEMKKPPLLPPGNPAVS